MILCFARGLASATVALVLTAGCTPSINDNMSSLKTDSTEQTPIAKTLDLSQAFSTGYYTDYDAAALPLTSVCSNKSLFGIAGTAVCQSGTTATPAGAADVAAGLEYWNNTGTKRTGTMAVGANVNGADGSASFLIPQGYYDGTKSCSASDSDIIPGNIASGVNILGVVGNAALESHSNCTDSNQTSCIATATYPSQSTPITPAANEDVLSGKEYFAGGALQTGSMANRGAIDASASLPGAGYFNGTVVNLPDPSHIVAGYTIMGVTGTATTNPTLSSATIAANGLTWNLLFNHPVTFGAGGNGGFAATMASAGTLTLTYVSGSGTNSLVYTGSVGVSAGDTGTLAYTQPGNGVEDVSDGDDHQSIPSFPVTNNSTVSASAYTTIFSDDFNRADNITIAGPWTTESDTAEQSSIASNKYRLALTGNTASYVSKTGLAPSTDAKLTFTVIFDAVSGLSGSYIVLSDLSANGVGSSASLILQINGGNLNQIRINYRDGASSLIIGTNYAYAFVAGTPYTFDVYSKTSSDAVTSDGSFKVDVNGVNAVPETPITTFARNTDKLSLGGTYINSASNLAGTIDNISLGVK